MFRKKFDSPLLSIITANKAQLEALSEAWLANGAQAFSIWGEHERLLTCWPESAYTDLAQCPEGEQMLSAPIYADGKAIGRFAIMGHTEEPQQRLLTAEAGLLSQILTMKTKFEHAAMELMSQAQLKTEIDMAAGIQLQLLPQTFPQIADLDIYARSLPATEVGGDFYDFSAYKNRPFVFAVGDISGKGMPAALFMAMTRVVLHTAARSMPVVDPHAILARVNEDLYDDFTEVGMFATVFIGSYNIQEKQLFFANAGHSPVVYCPANGPARMLEADGPAVGVLPISMCQSQALPFGADDVLVVGTDGLNECCNIENEMFGYERLLQTIKELAHLPAQEIGYELFETVSQFAEGYTQFDDQTMIVIKGVAQ